MFCLIDTVRSFAANLKAVGVINVLLKREIVFPKDKPLLMHKYCK